MLIAVLGLALGSAQAATRMDELYQARVVTPGDQVGEPSQGFQEALRQVVVKVSGYLETAKKPQLQKILPQAGRYVREFSYLGPADSPSPGGTSPPQRWLKVRFDEEAINRLLTERGLPVWGKTRPSLLVWLAVDDQVNPRFLTRDDPLPWQALERVAEERGLPLLLPKLDTQDNEHLLPADLWAESDAKLRAASQRYAPDVILAGRLQNQGQAWQAKWTLWQTGEVKRWEQTAAELPTLTAEGLGQAINKVASRFAPMGADYSTRALELRVSGINSLAAYGRVRAYLGSLDGVESARLSLMDGTQAGFQVRMRGGAPALQRALSLGGVLEESSRTTTPTQAAESTLNYRLRP